MDIRIGFTHSDPATGYSSFFDGYREGATQDVIDVTVPGQWDASPEAIAEAVFIATNSPYDVAGLADAIRQALTDLPVRSLSVGDTVEVAGVRMACAPVGFRTL